MKSEKELFKLATDMSFITDKLQDEKINDFVREELIEEANKIRDILFKKNYDVNMFLHYQEIYKKMSVKEYYKFLDTLDKWKDGVYPRLFYC